MITNISLVSVWVKDIDESLAFYTDVLGFEAKEDIQLGPDFRWCTVAHPAQPELGAPHDTQQAAVRRPDRRHAARSESGGLPGIRLSVGDCQATYEKLSAQGVEFLQPPEQRPYGVEALMRDNSGNWMVLVEPREFSPEDFAGVDMSS